MRKTKIVATLGPATSSPEMIERLILSGMDVARLNFSHGTPEEHRERIRIVREVSAKLGRSVACLQDLAGPKVERHPVDSPHDAVLGGEADVQVLDFEKITPYWMIRSAHTGAASPSRILGSNTA